MFVSPSLMLCTLRYHQITRSLCNKRRYRDAHPDCGASSDGKIIYNQNFSLTDEKNLLHVAWRPMHSMEV